MKTGKLYAMVSMPSNEDIRVIADLILNELDDSVSIEDKKENILKLINESIKITIVGERWESK